MPDADGRLSPVEMEFIQGWPARKRGSPFPCPVDATTVWHVNNQVRQDPIYPAMTTSWGDLPYPFVTLVCTTCGYILEFNAGVLGLYAVPPPPPPPPRFVPPPPPPPVPDVEPPSGSRILDGLLRGRPTFPTENDDVGR